MRIVLEIKGTGYATAETIAHKYKGRQVIFVADARTRRHFAIIDSDVSVKLLRHTPAFLSEKKKMHFGNCKDLIRIQKTGQMYKEQLTPLSLTVISKEKLEGMRFIEVVALVG